MYYDIGLCHEKVNKGRLPCENGEVDVFQWKEEIKNLALTDLYVM